MNGIPGNNTTVKDSIIEGIHATTVRLHNTDIVKVEFIPGANPAQAGNRAITLNSGGHRTATTKRRMNQVFKALYIPLQVYQKDFNWFVYYKNPWIYPGWSEVFTDGMTLYIDDMFSEEAQRRRIRKKGEFSKF